MKKKKNSHSLIIQEAVSIIFKNITLYYFYFSAPYRFLVLFFNCMLTFGSYFCFDMPSVLQDDFTNSEVSINSFLKEKN